MSTLRRLLDCPVWAVCYINEIKTTKVHVVALLRMQPTHIISGFDRDEGEEGKMLKLYGTKLESSCSREMWCDAMHLDSFHRWTFHANIFKFFGSIMKFVHVICLIFLVLGEMVASNSCDLSRQLWRTFRRPTAQTHREPERAKRSLAENFKTKVTNLSTFHISAEAEGLLF